MAYGASFNEIDRAIIEMRTKLARDNTRPLISAAHAAKERDYDDVDDDDRQEGSLVHTFPVRAELIRFREFGERLGQTSVI